MTTHEREDFGGKMDRIQVEQLARRAGLPDAVAARIAEVVTATGLPHERREEVFREMVAHFEDGLAAGKSAEQLLDAFGDGRRTAALIAEAKRVVTPEAMGGVTRDRVWSRLWRDARYAVRRMLARPAFTFTAVLSLALGIGANSAMFTLINDIILRKPTVTHPEQLVNIYQTTREYAFNVLSLPDLADIQRSATTAFAGVAGAKMSLAPYEIDGRPVRVVAEMVSSNYFQVLGLHALRGRLIEPADAPSPGMGAVVVLSERFWRRAFGGDPGIIGKPIRLNGGAYEVIGVMPADYHGALRAIPSDIFAPVMMIDQFEQTVGGSQLEDRGSNGTFVIGRLKPGATIEQARVELGRIAQDHKERKLQGWQEESSLSVLPNASVIIYPPVDKILVPVAGMLMLVVALVLVIACANLAGFLLARAVDRRREIAVRMALGATRAQLVAQLLVETVLLALAGGLAGIFLGRLALAGALSSDIPLPVPVDLALHTDWRVVGFSVAISVAAGIFFGLMPALQSTKMELASVIRDENTGGGRRKWALRHLLVGGQVAVSMVLLVLAGLFVRSLDAARNVDPGFGAKPAWMVWIGFPGNSSPAQVKADLDRMIRKVGEVPGVEQVGVTSQIHLNTLGTSADEITVPGIEPPPGRTTHNVDRAAIDTGFAGAIGLRLIAGRMYNALDLADSAPRVAIVNEAFAARFFPGRSAVGQRFRNGGGEIEVVGVVNNAKIRSLGEEPRPFIYAPLRNYTGTGFMVARTAGDPARLANQIREAMREANPESFAIDARSLQSHIATQSYPLKMGAAALMAFAMLAMVMACIGLYGAVSYAVAQRSREVGIRLSLGAAQGSVVRMLLWGGLRMVAGGAVAGLVGALLLGKLLEGLLFGVRAYDPVTLVAVPLLLIGVAALAAYVPARRAGRIDPVVALKYD